ncbi:maleylpyruvate isomerase family mycothiol-dependent enzyme [Micromonospora sp. NPDC003816]|uniref:maleylpyruvate isomerase family mycothiol-dependent enzyme n=1 Tax=Micromonospora sp. NPDC003816 TaxID=3364224 RepID=UPI0036750886
MNSVDSSDSARTAAQIVAARGALADDLADLTDAQWATRSLCGSWTVEETLAHLTSAARMTPFRWIRSMAAAGFRPEVHNRRRLREHLGATPAETLATFRAAVSATTAPSGHSAAWLGEVVVHGQDIRRPLGLHGGPSVEAATTVAEFFVSRNFAVNSRTVAKDLRWEATDGPFCSGAGPVVRGTTEALVMVLAGRRAYLADITGDGVETVGARI